MRQRRRPPPRLQPNPGTIAKNWVDVVEMVVVVVVAAGGGDEEQHPRHRAGGVVVGEDGEGAWTCPRPPSPSPSSDRRRRETCSPPRLAVSSSAD